MTILTESDREFYHNHGWVAVNGVFDEAEIAPIRELSMLLAQLEIESQPNPSYLTDRDHDGTLRPRKIDWPFLKHPLYRKFALDRRIHNLAGTLLQTEPFLVRDQVFLKPPRVGSAKPYHQDNAHMRCTPAEQVIAIWIALDDVDAENGCLTYRDRSHRLGLLEHREVPGARHNLEVVSRDGLEQLPEVAGALAKGGVLMHHGCTLHASGVNRSDRWRRAYTAHWVGGGVACENDTLEWAYSATIGGGRTKYRAP